MFFLNKVGVIDCLDPSLKRESDLSLSIQRVFDTQLVTARNRRSDMLAVAERAFNFFQLFTFWVRQHD